MRFFPSVTPLLVLSLAALSLLLSTAPASAQNRFPKPTDLKPRSDIGSASRPQATPRPKKQKPASQLISKQAQPKVVPRVLQRANPDNTHVLVSLGTQRAYLMVGEEIAIDTPISSGKSSAMTPKGDFSILQKNRDHRSSIYGSFVNSAGQVVRSGVSTKIDSAPSGTTYRGAPMQYFMRMTWTGVGMHVGELPGYPASHGCIRLPADIAPLIYERVKLGTRVAVRD